MLRTAVLAVATALALVAAAPAAASVAVSPQIDVWWLHASVHRVEQVNIDPAGTIRHRYRSPAGFWGPWTRLSGTADPAGELTVNGQTGLIYVRETTGVLRVTGPDGHPLCSDGPDWGSFHRC